MGQSPVAIKGGGNNMGSYWKIFIIATLLVATVLGGTEKCWATPLESTPTVDKQKMLPGSTQKIEPCVSRNGLEAAALAIPGIKAAIAKLCDQMAALARRIVALENRPQPASRPVTITRIVNKTITQPKSPDSASKTSSGVSEEIKTKGGSPMSTLMIVLMTILCCVVAAGLIWILRHHPALIAGEGAPSPITLGATRAACHLPNPQDGKGSTFDITPTPGGGMHIEEHCWGDTVKAVSTSNTDSSNINPKNTSVPTVPLTTIIDFSGCHFGPETLPIPLQQRVDPRIEGRKQEVTKNDAHAPDQGTTRSHSNSYLNLLHFARDNPKNFLFPGIRTFISDLVVEINNQKFTEEEAKEILREECQRQKNLLSKKPDGKSETPQISNSATQPAPETSETAQTTGSTTQPTPEVIETPIKENGKSSIGEEIPTTTEKPSKKMINIPTPTKEK